MKHERPPPTSIEGKELYLLDFCYKQETMDELASKAHALTVLDHHEGVREIVESLASHVYAEDRSGATIAWTYFHPNTSVPTFLQYVEDADLYKKVSDDELAVITYCYAQPWHFDIWDEHVRRVEDPSERAQIIEQGKVYREYFDLLTHQLAGSAELVTFEGHACYLVAGERMFVTPLGALLVKKHPPLALIVRVGTEGLRVSLRGNGSVDVAALARKYGGNGHPDSAAFSLSWGDPLPWTRV